MAEPPQKTSEQGAATVRELAPNPGVLYREDRWSWVQAQVQAMEQRDYRSIDWENLIEEVKDLGISLEDSWELYCGRAIEYLLKIQYARCADSFAIWEVDVDWARFGMRESILEHPGMKGIISQLHANAWKTGRRDAISALARDDLKYGPQAFRDRKHELEGLIPEKCPWSLFDIAGCDPTDENAEPSETVIPEAVRERLAMEEEIGYENPPPGVD